MSIKSDYKKAGANSIRKANSISKFHQVLILNKTLSNIFSNFAPKKIVTFIDKDTPWMTEYLKSQINWCNNI